MTDEQHRLYAFASYMRNLEPGRYDQTRDVHADDPDLRFDWRGRSQATD